MILLQAMLALASGLEPVESTTLLPIPSPAMPARQETDEKRMRFSFLVGVRSLDEDDWAPLDDPIALEANFEWRMRDSFLGFEVGTALSYDDTTIMGVDVDNTTFEFFAGVRATADLVDGHLQPYVGVGPSVIVTDLTAEDGGISVSDDDSSFGIYARAGLMWVFDGGFSLGADYRKLMGTDISLFGLDGDADFDQFAVSFGFGV